MNRGDRILLDAAVERMNTDTLAICWETAGHAEVSVYMGTAPGTIDRDAPAARSKDGCVQIRGLKSDRRYYFEINHGNERLLSAERRVPLQGSVNFRDLGGYKSADGRRVKWGRAFRSDGLARLTRRDLDLLQQMKIGRVYDLRTSSEAADYPDRLPEGVEHVHLPVTHGNFDFADAIRRLQKGDHQWLTPDFMINGYIRNLEDFGPCWAAVIRDLAESETNSAVLFHCTGGKDRTGTCAALILLALGVPEETVIDDHQLSNMYIAELLPRLYQRMEKVGIDPDRLFPYLTAPRQCIVAVIDYLLDTYGSAADYLVHKGGIRPETIDKLRQKLLE